MDLSAAPPTAAYLREVWRRREFAVVVPAQDLRAQNMDTAWPAVAHLLNPALLVWVYFFIFGVVLDTRRGVDNFLGFLIVGVVLFHLTQEGGAGCRGVHRAQPGVDPLHPVSSHPAAGGGRERSDPRVPSALGVALLAVLASGERPSPRWLLLIVVLAAVYVFNLGAALLVARIGASVRDLQRCCLTCFGCCSMPQV